MASTAGQPSGFTVTQPQVYFNKPNLQVATNVDLPVPIGMTTSDSMAPVTFNLDVPKGFDIVAGQMGEVKISDLTPKVLSDGWRRYSFAIDKPSSNKVFGRLFVQASGWQKGQSGELRYQFGDANWQSPQLAIPVHAVTLPAAPRLKDIMASMGWWSSASVDWPN